MSGAERRTGAELADLPERTVVEVWKIFAAHPTDALYITAHLAGTPKPMAADEGTLAHWAYLNAWLTSATPRQLAVAATLAETYIHNTTDEQYANIDEEMPNV